MTETGKPSVLVVDDHLEMARMLCDGLADRGYEAVPLASGTEAADLLARQAFDALVTDLRMPDMDGLSLLAHSRKLSPDRPVIIMTAFSAIDSAVESIRRGAYHYLTKPFKLDELSIFLGRALDERRVRREASALKVALREGFSRHRLIGRSPPMLALLHTMDRLLDTDAPVLITGETGTGKSLVARALHVEGQRSGGPFIAINCAALPEALLESELFGHVKGAFTGATASQKGLLREAAGGTLFLDEIGEMAPSLQAKLLHVLEEGAVRPVGSTREERVDVRVLAATHRDLREAIRAGRFREDLFYRLDVVSLEVPPLRHRREDIPDLIQHFLRAARDRHPAAKVERVAPDALKLLLDHAWPGNVRELSHAIERAVLLGRGQELQQGDLPPAVLEGTHPQGPPFRGEVIPIRLLQRRYAAWALERLGGHRGRTAERLGVDGKTLAKWLSEEPEAAEE